MNHHTHAHGDGTSSSSSDGEEDFNPDEYPQMNDDLSMPGSRKEMVNVIVTGFGPFGEHNVNASWEAVKELKRIGGPHNINLITYEIPVDYQVVKEIIPRIWEEHDPALVIHVGVSAQANEITIEKQANNDGYKRLDVTGNCPSSQCHTKNSEECIVSELNLDQLCEDVNKGSCLAMAECSTDAGKYLCEFIYYSSLCQDRKRCVFIHVPPLGEPYTARELGHGLLVILQSLLKQLDLLHTLPMPNQDLMNRITQQEESGLSATPQTNANL